MWTASGRCAWTDRGLLGREAGGPSGRWPGGSRVVPMATEVAGRVAARARLPAVAAGVPILAANSIVRAGALMNGVVNFRHDSLRALGVVCTPLCLLVPGIFSEAAKRPTGERVYLKAMYSRRTALFTLLGVVTRREAPRGRCRVR